MFVSMLSALKLGLIRLVIQFAYFLAAPSPEIFFCKTWLELKLKMLAVNTVVILLASIKHKLR